MPHGSRGQRPRMPSWVGWLVALMFIGPPKVWAQDSGAKLGRGIVNVLLGWMAYPSHFSECMGESSPGFLYLPCAAKALVPTLLHEALGAVEVVTFPIPWPLRGYESPYTSWSPGDYPWQREWTGKKL